MPLPPALAYFVAEKALSTAASKAVAALRERGWERELARTLRAEGFRVSTRRLTRWLRREDTWRALIQPSAERVEELLVTARNLFRPFLLWRRSSAEARESHAQNLVEAAVGHFISHLPSATAVQVANYQQLRSSARIERLQRRMLSLLEARDGRGRVESLPPSVRRTLAQVAQRSAELVDHLLVALTDDSGPRPSAIQELLAQPPPWLASGAADVWAVLAEFAEAYELASAPDLFMKVADMGAADRPRWLARSALSASRRGDHERARELIEDSRQVAGTVHPFADVVSAALDGDLDTLTSIDEAHLVADNILAALVAEGFARQHHVDKAIHIYEQACEWDNEFSSGRLRLAELLTYRASSGRGESKLRDLQRARNLALEAVNLRRAWKGASAVPLATACDIMLLLGDLRGVLRSGRAIPSGTASFEEAKDPTVRRVVANAAEAMQDAGVIRDLLSNATDEYEKELLRARLVLAEDGSRAEAAGAYQRAYDIATDELQRLEAQLGAAELGAHPLPGQAELEANPEPRAAFLLAMSESQRGLIDNAIARLRPLAAQDLHCANLLARAYVQRGDVDAAVDELRLAATRHKSPEELVAAASYLREAARYEEAEIQAQNAISTVPPEAPARAELHEMLIQFAFRRQDWQAAETRVRSAIAEHGENVSLRWALVATLFNQRRVEEAWGVLSRPPSLEPGNDEEAIVWIELRRRFALNAALVPRILDLYDQYKGSEQAAACALLSVMGLPEGIDMDEALRKRFQTAVKEFIARYPESKTLWQIEVGETIQDFIEATRQFLEPGAEAFERTRKLVNDCAAPQGFLSMLAGRPYALALLHRAGGCLPVNSADESEVESERQAARQALDAAVIIDESVVHVATLAPEAWRATRAAFRSLRTTQTCVHDLQASLDSFTPLSTGTLSWDPRADRPTFVEVSRDELARLKGRAEAMRRLVPELEMVQWDQVDVWEQLTGRSGEEPPGDAIPWLAPLDYAKTNGVPLYCDDVALRRLAAQVRVPAFGSLALYDILIERGQIDAKVRDDLVLSLRREYAVDFPFDESALVRLGEEDDWTAPSPAAFTFTRPTAWSSGRESIEAFGRACSRVLATDPTNLPSWLQAGIWGAARRVPVRLVPAVASTLLTHVTVLANADAALFARLVAAAQAVSEEFGAGDPLPLMLERVFDLAVEKAGPAVAARLVVGLASELEERNRATARGIAFGVRAED